jgi:hypothetical protein
MRVEWVWEFILVKRVWKSDEKGRVYFGEKGWKLLSS